MTRPISIAAALAGFTQTLIAAEIAGGAGKTGELKMAVRTPEPVLQPASDDPQKQLAKFKLPQGFTAELWAAEPMMGNPVAFDIDEKGRAFVAETYRYRTSVLDIRHYMFMLEDDMACRTTDDRIAMSKRAFPKDWQQLEIETEVVRLVQDKDGDGKADTSSAYAAGMNTMLDGINSGVLAIDGNVWATNIPNLWHFTGTTADGKAEKRESLSFGYGVRFSFTGHDMHGLAMGPDGRLYFSFGDRGAHVVTKEGKTLAFPDEGAVFRCEPDGSHMEVFYRGLRNPQELAFDDHGNLFTGDNDCDQGDRERWVYLVEGGDSGWRVGWQHPPLGKAHNMWLTEHLWEPRRDDTPAWVLSPIMNIPDGPSGVAYYPGTGLPEQYRGAFLVCGFKGSSAKSAISWWKVKPDGAGFAVEQSPATFLDNVQATDVTFGPDSRVYFTEWGEGWEGQGRGRIFRLVNAEVEKAQAAQIAEVKKLLGEGFKQRSSEELAKLLSHPDQRVRLRAQWALAEKLDAAEHFIGAAKSGAGLARLHGIWGLGHTARLAGYKNAANEAKLLVPLLPLLTDADAEVRAQTMKVLGEGKVTEAFAPLAAALGQPGARTQFFAAQALAKLGLGEAVAPAVALAEANADRDIFIRHACVNVLAAYAKPVALSQMSGHPSKSAQLIALLALRRQGSPLVARFLGSADAAIVQEAARAIVDGGIEAAMPELAKFVGKGQVGTAVPSRPSRASDAKTRTAEDRGPYHNFSLRALNAAFRSGDAAALAAFAGDPKNSASLRVEALTLLGLWAQPPARDRVAGVFRPLPARDAKSAAAALAKVLPALLDGKATSSAAMQTVVSLGMKDAGDAVAALVGRKGVPAKVRGEALRTLAALDHPKLAEAVKLALTDDDSSVRVAASAMLGRVDPEQAAQQLGAAFSTADLADKKQIITALGDLKGAGAGQALARLLDDAKAGKIPAEALLELIEAAGKHAATKAPLDSWIEAQVVADKLRRFSFALAGGDAEAGEKVFKEHAIAQCFRCHKVNGSGGEAGPDLSDAGKRLDRRGILESIVDPNAKIAHGFDSVICTMTSGDIKAGILKAETPVDLTLLPTGAPLETLKKADIKTRDVAPSGMPPGLGELMTKRELRDVVEFVAGLK